MIVDAGSGLSGLSRSWRGRNPVTPVVVLFSHYHLDHLLGLPGFDLLRETGADIELRGGPASGTAWRNVVETFCAPPYWPVPLTDQQAGVRFRDLPAPGTPFRVADAEATSFAVPHPNGCLAFRFELPSGSIVVATDTEYREDAIDRDFVSFCREASLLVYDSHYMPEEIEHHRGWGHSTWRTACALAGEAGVGELLLTHHSPARTDAELDRIVTQARGLFPATRAAHDGLECLLG